jgi:hypothetical protein
MTDFISKHPYVIYYLGVGMIGIIVYMFKKAKKLEESALLHEVGKVATSIENMALEISRLFKRDLDKGDAIGQLNTRMGRQETRCSEREKVCPAFQRMIHIRDADTIPHKHGRLTNGDSDEPI